MCKGGAAVSPVIRSNFGCAFLEYQMFKYRGITLAYLFVAFCISFTFKIFQTLHYFIFPFATRKLHYKRHILNFVILLWSDRYLVSVLISQKTPHAAISLLSTTHLLLYKKIFILKNTELCIFLFMYFVILIPFNFIICLRSMLFVCSWSCWNSRIIGW